LPRSSVGASAAASSSAGQTLISGNRARATRYPAPIELKTNKKEPASEGKGTAQLQRLELRSVVKEHQRQVTSTMLCCRPQLISVRPSTAPPTMKTIGPVDPAETHDWLMNEMTKRAKTPTPTIGANPLVSRESGRGCSPLRSGEPPALGEVLRYCLAMAMRRRSSGSMKWS
jgi:hypothetical protein